MKCDVTFYYKLTLPVEIPDDTPEEEREQAAQMAFYDALDAIGPERAFWYLELDERDYRFMDVDYDVEE